MRIDTEVAEALLLAFGVARSSRAYDRWKKPYGFDLTDFDEVLFESPAVVVLDWRCCLLDEVSEFAGAFERCGYPLLHQEHGEGGLALRASDGALRVIGTGPPDDPDLDLAFSQIQGCLPRDIEIRRSPENDDSDTSVFAVLRRSDWEAAESAASEVVAHFFQELTK